MPQATVFDDIADEKKKPATIFDDLPDEPKRQIDYSKKTEPSNLESLGTMARDAFEGVGSGVASTGVGTYDLVRKIPGVGKVLPPVHPSIRAATQPPDSTAGRLGKGLEQVGEFFVPMGAVNRGVKVIEGVTKGSKAAPIVNALGRAALETGSAAGVTAAQTGGDPEAVKTAAKTAGALSTVVGVPMAMARTVPFINNALNAKGRKFYEESLKIPPGSADIAERTAMIDEGLHNVKAPASKTGYKKVTGAIQGIEDIVKPAVAQGAAQGMTVGPTAVADRITPVRPRFDTVNPVSDRNALDAARQEFLGEHQYQAPYTPGKMTPAGFRPSHPAMLPGPNGNMVPTPGGTPGTASTAVDVPIPVDEAQRIKSNTYRRIKDAAYGEQKAPSTEGMKALARGLNEESLAELEKVVPGISKLGPREAVLIDLREQFERFLAREGNKQTVPLGAAASHTGLGALAIKFLDSNPALKSRLAIALANRGGDPGPIISGARKIRVGVPAFTYGVSQNQQQ